MRTSLDLTDEAFLHEATLYVEDGEIDAAFAMLSDHELTLHKACAEYGGRKVVIMALQGKLKEATVRDGKIAPGERYVNPWAESACIDKKHIAQLAAFAIYRTVEQPAGLPQLFKRGTCVN